MNDVINNNQSGIAMMLICGVNIKLENLMRYLCSSDAFS